MHGWGLTAELSLKWGCEGWHQGLAVAQKADVEGRGAVGCRREASQGKSLVLEPRKQQKAFGFPIGNALCGAGLRSSLQG